MLNVQTSHWRYSIWTGFKNTQLNVLFSEQGSMFDEVTYAITMRCNLSNSHFISIIVEVIGARYKLLHFVYSSFSTNSLHNGTLIMRETRILPHGWLFFSACLLMLWLIDLFMGHFLLACWQWQNYGKQKGSKLISCEFFKTGNHPLPFNQLHPSYT